MFITKVSFFFLNPLAACLFFIDMQAEKSVGGGWLSEERNATPSGVACCAKRAVEMVKSRRLN